MSEYCKGCGMNMWEYSDDADWCLECAPECYDAAGRWDA